MYILFFSVCLYISKKEGKLILKNQIKRSCNLFVKKRKFTKFYKLFVFYNLTKSTFNCYINDRNTKNYM